MARMLFVDSDKFKRLLNGMKTGKKIIHKNIEIINSYGGSIEIEIDEFIKKLRNAKEDYGAQTVNIEKYNDDDPIEIYFTISREETDEEYRERMRILKAECQEEEIKELRLYLQLKKKFEHNGTQKEKP